ncbi:sugar ABC transporter permease [Luteipulveratus mongoliensis]|uniref:Sugar ABC transporter permease n=1 Tax=Luteipulveratus mongoliensis TaxID=571913 RepID=A0A0K1JQQ9_9MICO|nr:sugar ABC transporter permease [Luteipulveratus mongoliensis]
MTSSDATPVAPSREGLGSRRRRRENLAGWLFLAPDAIGLLLFVAIPMVLALGIALFEVDSFGHYDFIGLDNFQRMFGDPMLWSSIWVTVKYVVLFVPLSFVAGLGLALLVRDYFPGVAIVRTLLFLPNAVSLVVVGLLWQFLLVDKQGVLSKAGDKVGLDGISWLGDPKYALISYVLISVWFTMGYQMLLFMAGLKDINPEYLDAAKIDGATPWQRFRHVIWPLLQPTSFFVLITSLVASVTGLQAFDLVFVLTKGGPDNRTSTVVFYVYQQAFTFGHYGYAAAITVILVAFLMLVTGLLFRFTKGGRFHAG